MRQRLAHEWLDGDEGTPEEIDRSLRELWWINQHLGGLSTWRTLLREYARRQAGPGPQTMLDIGSGTGELARSNALWLAAHGVAMAPTALDRQRSHFGARLAPGLDRVAADAFHLPFADGAFDLVTCNLFLHHFHDAAADPRATLLLREMARVASRAVLINDLDRSWLPYLAIRLLGVRFSRITRHDGPRSVRQAYTRPELEALGRRAGGGAWRARRMWPYRLGLILWRR